MIGRVLWVHPYSGIAGDMMLGALIDAGAAVDEIRSGLGRLAIDGWELRTENVERHGIGATDVSVVVAETQPHRAATDIIDLVETADLPARVVDRAVAVFTALAEAEGRVHRVDPASVHFHEVGGIDAIVDVVGTCLALEALDVDSVVVGPVAVGTGTVTGAHGVLPNPAPATVELLRGWPTRGLDTAVELTTPTGAALVAALGDHAGPLPAMTIEATGFGAGDARTEPQANLLQVVVGTGDLAAVEPMVILETNIDDATGEMLAHAVEELLAAGARDVWLTPIIMKRGRPAQCLSVLAGRADAVDLGERLLAETGSIGYRLHSVDRRAVGRTMGEVEVDGRRIAIKQTAWTAKAEYSDTAAAARALGRPARLVAAEAERLWAESPDDLA